MADPAPETAGVIVVTGGGRGIGAAVCRLAAERGFAVAVNYAHAVEAARALAAGVKAQGGRAVAIEADVSIEGDVVRLFETAERELGPVTGLVNNAAITGLLGRLDDLPAEILQRVIAVNITGAVLCAREAVRRMSTRHGGGGGSIVSVSSRAAQLGSPGEWVHYAATKGAIETLTLGLAREVAGEGIRVNAVSAGLIDTELHTAAGVPDRVRQLAPTVPMGRAGQPEEVAEAILWLMSPAASYVNGAILAVAGGR